MKRPALSRRLMVWVGVPVVLLWLVAAAWVAMETAHEADEMFDQQLMRTASSVLAVMPAKLRARSSRVPGQELPRSGREEDHLAITVHDRYGHRIVYSTELPTLVFDPGPAHFHTVAHQGRRWRVYQRWDVAQRYWVQVAAPLDERDELLQSVARALLLPLLAILLLVPLAIWLGLWMGLRPLRALSRSVSGPLTRTPRLTRDDLPAELVPLTTALDTLVSDLRGTLERERRFTADAAHELRNPLAVLRLELDLAGVATDATARADHLQRARTGLQRMERLVAQLLTLARVENLESLGDAGPLQLESVASQVVSEAGERAVARGISLGLDVRGDSWVQGSDGLLAVALHNLVDNAIRHARDNGEISVGIERRDGSVELVVDDDGPGFPDTARLGERFHRPEGSIGVGTGLGLSIVEAIVALHQGRIELDRSPAGGARVRLSLPALNRSPSPAPTTRPRVSPPPDPA
jgi:signal transduction histidine kinase